MRRLRPPASFASRTVLAVQLACLALGAVALLLLRDRVGPLLLASRFGLIVISGIATIIGWTVITREHGDAIELAERMAQERALNLTLEQAVVSRTTELEDAQRVLQRMWWLGQQITLELNPQRVLERFLEAVTAIVQGEGGIVGMVGDDGKIHIVVGSGSGASISGMSIPIAGSAMGRVIRTGTSWTASDVSQRLDEVDDSVYAKVASRIKGVAIVP